MDKYYFHNLISSNEFEKLTTSEKIRWCLEKDIFYYAPEGCTNYMKFNCVPFDNIDLSDFDKEPFILNKIYKLKKDSISLGEVFSEEIFYKICEYSAVGKGYLIENETNRIEFKIKSLNTEEDKLSYLTSEIDTLNLFDLPILDILYSKNNEELSIGPAVKYKMMEVTSEVQLGWITGRYDYDYSNLELEENDFFVKFEKDFKKFLIYEYCQREIKMIKENSKRIVLEQKPLRKLDNSVQKIILINMIIESPNWQQFTNNKKAEILTLLIDAHKDTLRKAIDVLDSRTHYNKKGLSDDFANVEKQLINLGVNLGNPKN